MNQQRFNKLFVAARSAKQALDHRGFVQRNRLPKITLLEHDYLSKNHPKMAAFTRVFDYSDREYVEDTGRMSPSRLPRVTEIWVGARSLGCIPGESAETESEGLSASQMDQEDAAELTDLQTLLYHDPDSGRPVIEDPDTGVCRPIRTGDCITVVRGSNDDLDALFLEEPDDPRNQNDLGAVGGDHKWSDRFRANTDLEQTFLTTPGHRIPNTAAPEGIRWEPNEFEVRRLAQSLATKIIDRERERHPDWENRLNEFTDEAEGRLRAMADDLAFNQEGQMIRGHFITKDEFFASFEANLRELENATSVAYEYPVKQVVIDGVKRDTQVRRAKARPSPVNWDQVRTPTQKRARTRLIPA